MSISWFVSQPTPLTTTEQISTNFDGVWVSAQNRPLLTLEQILIKGEVLEIFSLS